MNGKQKDVGRNVGEIVVKGVKNINQEVYDVCEE